MDGRKSRTSDEQIWVQSPVSVSLLLNFFEPQILNLKAENDNAYPTGVPTSGVSSWEVIILKHHFPIGRSA